MLMYKSLLVRITAHLTSDEIIIGNIKEQLHKKIIVKLSMGFTSSEGNVFKSSLKVGCCRYSVGSNSGLICHVWYPISYDVGVLRGLMGNKEEFVG